MKKLNKLTSFILVLTLIFSSLVFLTPSTQAIGDTSIDTGKDIFNPSANFYPVKTSTATTDMTSLDITDKSAVGAKKVSTSLANTFGGGNVDVYMVEEEGEDPYAFLVPTDEAVNKGMVASHVQINSYIYEQSDSSKVLVTYDPDTPTYYVFEMDVATESSFFPLGYSFIPRNDTGSNGLDAAAWYPRMNNQSVIYDKMTPGVFHHLTFIGDLNNNIMYVYMNNELFAAIEDGVFTTLRKIEVSESETYTDGYTYYTTSGKSVYLQSMRIQLGGGTTYYGEVTVNQSYAFKNTESYVYQGNAPEELAASIGQDTLVGNGYTPGDDLGDLPTLVTVNGEEYNNIPDADKALNTYKLGNEVNACHNLYNGYVTVNSDATINVYSLTFPLRAGEDVELVKNSDTTYTATYKDGVYKHTAEVLEEDVHSIISSDNIDENDIVLDVKGNLISNGTKVRNGSEEHIKTALRISEDGNKYLYTYDAMPDDDYASGDSYYINTTCSYLRLREYKYIVFDYDIYSEGEFINFYSYFNSRLVTATNETTGEITGTDAIGSTQVFLDSIPVETGKWHHLTFVAVTATSKMFIYVDGVKVTEVSNALYNTSSYNIDNYDLVVAGFRHVNIYGGNKSGQGYYLNGNMSVATDNYALRAFDNDSTADPDTLGLYGTYEMPKAPVLATVDGKEYFDVTSLSEAVHKNYDLTSEDYFCRDVVFYAPFRGSVYIDGRANLNKNNVSESNILIADGCTTNVADPSTEQVFEVYRLAATRGEDVIYGADDAAAITAALTKSAEDENMFTSITPSDEVTLVTSTSNLGNTFDTIKASAGTYLSLTIDDTDSANKVFKNCDAYFGMIFNIGYISDTPDLDYKITLELTKSTTAGDETTESSVMIEVPMVNVLKSLDIGEFAHVAVIFASHFIHDHAESSDTINSLVNKMYIFVDNILLESRQLYTVNQSETSPSETVDGVAYAYEYFLNSVRFGDESVSSDMLYDDISVLNNPSKGSDFIITPATKGKIYETYSEYSNDVAIPTAHPYYMDEDVEQSIYATPVLAQVGSEVFMTGQEDEIEDAISYTYHYELLKVQFLRTPETPIVVKNNDVEIDLNGLNMDDLVSIDKTCTYTKEDNSAVIIVDAPFKANVDSENATGASIYSATKYGAVDNVFSSVYINSASGNRTTTIKTDHENENEYVFNSPADHSLPCTNDYTNFSANSSMTAYTGDANNYIIVDFDIALSNFTDSFTLETRTKGTAYVEVTVTNSDGSTTTTQKQVDKWGGSFEINTYFAEVGAVEGEYAHITLVCQPSPGDGVTQGARYLFINGKKTSYKGNLFSSGEYEDDLYFEHLRIGQNTVVPFMYDNVYIRNVTDDTMTAALTSGDLSDYAGSIFTSEEEYEYPALPTIATVDGIAYQSVLDLETVLSGDRARTVEFFHVPTRAVEISCPATIITNNLSTDTVSFSDLYTVNEMYMVDEEQSTGDIMFITAQSNKGLVTITINDTVIFSEYLVYGTDIAEYLTENGIVCTSIVVDGDIYKDIQWENDLMPSGTVSAESHSFVGSNGTICTADYVYINDSGEIVETDDESAIINFLYSTPSKATTTHTIALNKDLAIPMSSRGAASQGTKNIYMNGHTISISQNAASHAFVLQGSGCYNFYGEGYFDFSSDISNQNIFYSNNTYTGTVTLSNITLTTGRCICDLRAGTLVFDNCDVDIYTSSGVSSPFRLGQDHGSYTYTGKSSILKLIDTNLQHRYTYVLDRYSESTPNIPLFSHRITETGGYADPLAEVLIENSQILTKGSLAEAYYSVGTNVAYDKSNLKIYINASTIHANGISYHDFKQNSVIFYDDVYTNITDISLVGRVIDLVAARTHNDVMPVLYTSHNYATVEWSNGDVEFWAAGNIPTNDACKFDDISEFLPSDDTDTASGVQKGGRYQLTKCVFENESSPMQLYSNVTLSEYIGFNIYIPTTESVKAVYMNSKFIEANPQTFVLDHLNNIECYCYTIRFAPQNSVRDFNLIILLEDGRVLSRSASILTYANQLVAAEYSNSPEKNKALLQAMLSYMHQAVMYTGYSPDMTELSALTTTVGLPTKTFDSTLETKDTSSLATYIRTAHLNLNDMFTMRYNINTNDNTLYDAEKFSFTVDGKEGVGEIFIPSDKSYIEISLRAYYMSGDIEIFYDHDDGNGPTSIGEYNLYTYCKQLENEVNDTTSTGLNAKQALKLAQTIWIYAEITDQYTAESLK